ncbi:hypothetical protein WR25_24683 [Diploscapter pachys]|uniref:Uncharacterized protein n=1 Tax=Diploscapter pachys TaxID=2018661 RepID=A0A2A2KC34_9BILA|nr:hypothetical protein WR25_24683 [Diploscapter pachys]
MRCPVDRRCIAVDNAAFALVEALAARSDATFVPMTVMIVPSHALLALIGLGQHRGGCLAQDLRLGEGSRFGREIGVRDLALRRGKIGGVGGEVVHRRLELVLRGTQAGAVGADRLQCRVDRGERGVGCAGEVERRRVGDRRVVGQLVELQAGATGAGAAVAAVTVPADASNSLLPLNCVLASVELMRCPVDRRCMDVCSIALAEVEALAARSEATLVPITAMWNSLVGYWHLTAAPPGRKAELPCWDTAGRGPNLRNLSGRQGGHYWSSLSTPCWLWLAWLSIAVEAWLRICALARAVVSAEKSASVIWLFAAVRLVALVVRLFTADWSWFCAAPRPAR